MAFTVTIGSGVAIIPCDNTTARAPYTHALHLPPLVSTRTRIKLHVAREDKVPSGSNWPDEFTRNIEPDFFHGKQWNLLGFFVQYLWLIGFGFAAIIVLSAVLTYHEPPQRLKDSAAKKYSVQSGEVLQGKSSEVFKEPDTYDSDVFDSNPTELAPSLE